MHHSYRCLCLSKHMRLHASSSAYSWSLKHAWMEQRAQFSVENWEFEGFLQREYSYVSKNLPSPHLTVYKFLKNFQQSTWRGDLVEIIFFFFFFAGSFNNKRTYVRVSGFYSMLMLKSFALSNFWMNAYWILFLIELTEGHT